MFQANLPPPTPSGGSRALGSSRSSLGSGRSSIGSIKTPPSGSGRPTPVQIGADFGRCNKMKLYFRDLDGIYIEIFEQCSSTCICMLWLK